MDKAQRRKWNQDGKRDAVIDVLSHLMSQTAEQGHQCVDSDAHARELFENPSLGNIDVPNNVRIVFVSTGDRDKKDKGSVVIELPALDTASAEDPQLVRYPGKFSDRPRNWDKFGKCSAIRDVLRHIISHPEIRSQCLENDAYVRRIFRDVGFIQVPDDVKAIFVPLGEIDSKEFGSLVIELPKPGPVPKADSNPTVPNPLLLQVLCCYNLWR
jgi:hypothetical protein